MHMQLIGITNVHLQTIIMANYQPRLLVWLIYHDCIVKGPVDFFLFLFPHTSLSLSSYEQRNVLVVF